MACAGKPDYAGATVIATQVQKVRNSAKTSGDVRLAAVSMIVPFGPTQLNLTLQRVANCSQGGPLDICSICKVVSSIA